MKRLVIGLAVLALLPAAAQAQCRMGGKCNTVERTSDPFLHEGAEMPDGARMVMNPRYYGLPRVDGDYRYYVYQRQVYRVDNQTLSVIDRIGTADQRLW